MTSIAPGYEVVRPLGKGGMGVVFLARSRDGRDVAVKLLTRLGADARERFARERRLLASLGEREGFVPLLDQGEGPEGPFLVMPFLEGGTLRDRLERGPLGIDEVVRLGRSLARALERAHESGIVHRDLKPENILFTGAGEPLVADLGIAKHFAIDRPGGSVSVDLSRTGEVRGTVGYMPPEQIADAARVGPEADVFAIGAMLYESLTGAPAFAGATWIEVVAKTRSGAVTRPSELRPDVPRWLDAALLRALAPNPGDRFADAGALARALEARPRRRAPVALFIIFILVLVAGAVVVRPKREPPPAPVATEAPVKGPAWFVALPPEKRPTPSVLAHLVPLEAPNEYRSARDGSVLVFVPGGRFLMGDDASAMLDMRPRHEVELSAYLIGKYEASVGQWRAYARGRRTRAEEVGGRVARIALEEKLDGAGGGSHLEYVVVPGATWESPHGDGVPVGDDTPVVQVMPREAMAYAEWAGLRLPTEAEWERAATWTEKHEKRGYPWGDEDAPELRNGFQLVDRRPGPVTAFPGGASPVGALGMSGNVAEWVLDAYLDTAYKDLPSVPRDPCFVGGIRSLSRGGSLMDMPANLRGDHRRAMDLDQIPNDTTGFRVALSADGSRRPR